MNVLFWEILLDCRGKSKGQSGEIIKYNIVVNIYKTTIEYFAEWADN